MTHPDQPGTDAALLDFTRRLVRCRSHGTHGGDVVRLVAAEMTRLGFHTVTVDGHGNTIGWVGDPTSGPLLLADGHVDTIPPHTPEGWLQDPFAAALYVVGAYEAAL